MTTELRRRFAELYKTMKIKRCLIPGCKGKRIIDAHTIQKKGGISAISKAGLVYSFSYRSHTFLNLLEADTQIRSGYSMDGKEHYWQEPDKIGINTASTITGFCSEHDRVIFAPIELQDFVPTIQQVQLFALRCLAYELHAKEITAKEKIPDLLKSYSDEKEWNEIIDIQHEGTIIGFEFARKCFNELYNAINNVGTLDLDFVLFEVDKIPEIVCSFSRIINMDMEPVTQEMIDDRNLQWITCSCFCKKEKGFILFSWNHLHDKPREFLEKVISNPDPGNVIANLFFLCSENVFFSIDWWNSLSCGKKIAIEKAVIELSPNINALVTSKPRKLVDWSLKHSSNCGL